MLIKIYQHRKKKKQEKKKCTIACVTKKERSILKNTDLDILVWIYIQADY
jgi:hypothetical protein